MNRQDPIREWQAGQRQAHEDAEAARMLGIAITEAPAENDDATTTATEPPVESLSAGGQPADYRPPTVNQQFGEWVRESIHR